MRIPCWWNEYATKYRVQILTIVFFFARCFVIVWIWSGLFPMFRFKLQEPLGACLRSLVFVDVRVAKCTFLQLFLFVCIAGEASDFQMRFVTLVMSNNSVQQCQTIKIEIASILNTKFLSTFNMITIFFYKKNSLFI